MSLMIIYNIVDRIASLWMILILVRAVLSWVPEFSYRHRDLVSWLDRLTDPIVEPLRRLIPPANTGGLDISPVLAIIAIQLARNLLLAVLV